MWETDCIGNLVILELLKKHSAKKLSMLRIKRFMSECSVYQSVHTAVVENSSSFREFWFVTDSKDAVNEKQREELQWQYLLFPQALKKTLGFPLIRFEDAVINLDPFTRVHPYETQEFIINDILKHFQEVSVTEIMMWQRLNFSWLGIVHQGCGKSFLTVKC